MSPDETEAEAMTLAAIQRALDDRWEDGKRRFRLKRVMTERMERVRRVTGFQSLDALRTGNPGRYALFLAGCRRAMVRDAAIEAGHLSHAELGRLRERFETRDLHAAFDDQAEAES